MSTGPPAQHQGQIIVLLKISELKFSPNKNKIENEYEVRTVQIFNVSYAGKHLLSV
jgi:hypothetical protein